MKPLGGLAGPRLKSSLDYIAAGWSVVGGRWWMVDRDCRKDVVRRCSFCVPIDVTRLQILRTRTAVRCVSGRKCVGAAHALPEVMPATNSFRDLRVWQEAMTLAEEIHAVSKKFPSDERFGLTAQVRRAAVSIPSNIGEGARRKRRKAYLHHLDIALGSQGEVDVQLELAAQLTFCTESERTALQQRVDRIGRMLNALIN